MLCDAFTSPGQSSTLPNDDAPKPKLGGKMASMGDSGPPELDDAPVPLPGPLLPLAPDPDPVLAPPAPAVAASVSELLQPVRGPNPKASSAPSPTSPARAFDAHTNMPALCQARIIRATQALPVDSCAQEGFDAPHGICALAGAASN